MGTGTLRRDDPLLRVALPASLAIHLAIAALIPALAVVQGDGPSVETISFARIIRVQREVVRPVVRVHVAAAPQRAPLPHLARATPAPARLGTRPVHVLPAQPLRTQSVAPVVAAPRAGAPDATTGVSAAPIASAPAQTTTVASTRHADRQGGYLPLGVDQPDPVLDPSVLQSLAKLGVTVTLVVTVDEHGHTERVRFQPPLDDATEARIRALLADASWDPAVCGAGIPCEGTTTIKL